MNARRRGEFDFEFEFENAKMPFFEFDSDSERVNAGLLKIDGPQNHGEP